MRVIIGRFSHLSRVPTSNRILRWSHALSLLQVRDLFRFALRRLREERLPQVAGSLTFTTVLGMVPLLTIALALFTAFPLFSAFRRSLELYFSDHLMPKMIANTVLEYLNQFASKSMRLSAVGAVALVVTAVAMMSMIDRVFNRIWRISTPRPLLQRILMYWALLTLGPLLIGMSLSLTSYLFSSTGSAVMKLRFVGELFYGLLSLGLTAGAFTLLYATVPNRVVDWKDAAAGGLLAGLLFEAAKRLFAFYITQFPTYTLVYGSIAAVPIFLLWIYMFWMITLTGALFAAALPIVKFERWWHVPTPGSAFVDAVAILKVLYEARTRRASSAVDANRIRNRTRLGFDESETLLENMLGAGWVARIKTDLPRKRFRFRKRRQPGLERWTLIANPEQLRLADVYRRFVFDTGSDAALVRHVEEVIEQGLPHTLAAHFKPVSAV
ncbi:MAG: YihY family inner membrane protein [Pseudomonadota bacterium]